MRKVDPKTPSGCSHQINVPFKGAQRGHQERDIGGLGVEGSMQMLLLQVFAQSWRSISLSLQYGACGQVRLHATISSPNTLFPKSPSPKPSVCPP